MILKFLKLVFFFLSFGRYLDAQNIKSTSAYNLQFLARPTVIDLNPGELCNYPLMVTLDRYDGRFINFGDLSAIFHHF